MKGRNHELRIRTLINGLSALIVAFFIFLAQYPALRWLFAATVAIIGAIATWEYDQLVAKKGWVPAIGISIVSVVLYTLFSFLNILWPGHPFLALAPEVILGLAFLSCLVYYAIIDQPPIVNLATSFLGIVYIGYPLGLFIAIMYGTPKVEGSWWIIYLLAITKSTDIGAYFIGTYFGKRKLALKLSPNKTLEGAVGGLSVAVLMSIIVVTLGKKYGRVFENFSYGEAVILGLILGVLAQVGDLAESFLKRDARVKDSNKIPAVGGILDMIDSLLFTTPIVYIFLTIQYNNPL